MEVNVYDFIQNYFVFKQWEVSYSYLIWEESVGVGNPTSLPSPSASGLFIPDLGATVWDFLGPPTAWFRKLPVSFGSQFYTPRVSFDICSKALPTSLQFIYFRREAN